MADDLLSPEDAEQLVQQRIEQFGLGALPQVSVTPLRAGKWCVAWDTEKHVVAPMTKPQWETWLERHIGPVSPQKLQTTEG